MELVSSMKCTAHDGRKAVWCHLLQANTAELCVVLASAKASVCTFLLHTSLPSLFSLSTGNRSTGLHHSCHTTQQSLEQVHRGDPGHPRSLLAFGRSDKALLIVLFLDPLLFPMPTNRYFFHIPFTPPSTSTLNGKYKFSGERGTSMLPSYGRKPGAFEGSAPLLSGYS